VYTAQHVNVNTIALTCVNTVVPPCSSTTPSMCTMCSRFQHVGAAKRAIKLPFCINAAPVVVRGSSLL
jgi:hypothetical protein